MESVDVPELREIAVQNSILSKNYPLAEELCKDALNNKIHCGFNRIKPWAYILEQIYEEFICVKS